MTRTIYREAALHKYSSPERADQLLQVTGPRAWLGLFALMLAVATATVWSIFGSVPVTVTGSGITQFHVGGTRAVVTQGSGLLTDVRIKPGDVVEVGQPIATLTMPDLDQQIVGAQLSLNNIKQERAQLEAFYDDYLAHQKRISSEQRERYDVVQSDADKRVAVNQSMLNGMGHLRDKGFATVEQVEAARERVMAATHDRDQAAVDSLQVASQERAEFNQRDEALRENGDRLLQATTQLVRLKTMREVDGTVRSPVTGQVLQIDTQLHVMLASGTTVALVEVGRHRATAVIYVPAIDGKLIAPGMRAKVSPTTVKPEQYGSIIGTVRTVESYPATPADMMRVLNNQSLVGSFATAGPELEVILDLQEDPRSFSGFRWTSADGPPIHVTSGTIASARITVDSQAPITLVLPFFKKLFGL